MVTPGFVETHIHLTSPACWTVCPPVWVVWTNAIGEVCPQLKREFTPARTFITAPGGRWKSAILNGTTHVRTHLEVDPVIGLRSLEGIQPLVQEFKWAMDIEICMFPQEGLLNRTRAATN